MTEPKMQKTHWMEVQNPNKSAYVLAAVMGQTMIVNRFDMSVSTELLDFGEHDSGVAVFICRLAQARRQSHGDGVVIVDGGANIGCYSVFWSRFMAGATEKPWGSVIAFEPQEWPYYQLCGNIVLNNCYNVEARNEALMSIPHEEMITMPAFDPLKPHEAGGWPLSIQRQPGAATKTRIMKVNTIDNLRLPRLDILKLDLEGGEPVALEGARTTIAIERPIIIAEHPLCGHQAIVDRLPEYDCVTLGAELLCVHRGEQNPQLGAAMRQMADMINAMPNATRDDLAKKLGTQAA